MEAQQKESIQILLATALPSDKRKSIDLYHSEVKSELKKFSDLIIKTIDVCEATAGSAIYKRFIRYIKYPQKISEALRTPIKLQSVLHILDQDYAHLSRSDIKCVVTCHDISEFKSRSLSKIRFMLWKKRIIGMKKANRIITVSSHTANDIVELLGIDNGKIVVNHEGISRKFSKILDGNFNSEKATMLNALKKNQLFILHVGSNILRKNIPMVLNVLSILKRNRIPAKLIKIGNDLYKDGYAALIKRNGITDDIIFLNSVSSEELVEIYNLCDFLLFPSLYEGFGRPIIEAQACGLPCVLSNSSCLPEIGGNAALYSNPNDVDGFARCCLELISNSELRDILRIKGIENAKKYTIESHANRLKTIYKDILEDR